MFLQKVRSALQKTNKNLHIPNFCSNFATAKRKNEKKMPNEMLNPYSIEELNARVAISEIQIATGNVYSHEAVMQALEQKSIQTA